MKLESDKRFNFFALYGIFIQSVAIEFPTSHLLSRSCFYNNREKRNQRTRLTDVKTIEQVVQINCYNFRRKMNYLCFLWF